MPFFSNSDLKVAQAIIDWVQASLIPPHPELKRSANSTGEPVCPFVRPALDTDALYIAIHREVNGHSAEALIEVARSYLEPFKMAAPFDERGRLLKALLLVFPEIPASQAAVLDLSFERLKPLFIEDGLMITQAYPASDLRSVHNPVLRVYQSPYPLLAMRHMALHDILFVGKDERWFQEYNLRFGQRFRDPSKLDEWEQPLLQIYQRTRTSFLD